MLQDDSFLMLVRDAYDAFMLSTYPQHPAFTPFDAAVAVSQFCGLSLNATIAQMNLADPTAPVNRFTILKCCERILTDIERARSPRPEERFVVVTQRTAQQRGNTPPPSPTPVFIPAVLQGPSPAQRLPPAPMREFGPSARQLGQSMAPSHTPQRPPRPTDTSPDGLLQQSPFARSVTRPPLSESPAPPGGSRDSVGSGPARSSSRATVNDAWREVSVGRTVVPSVTRSYPGSSAERSPSPTPDAPAGGSAVAAAAAAVAALTPKHQCAHPMPASSSTVSRSSTGVKVCKQFARNGTCCYGSRCLYHHVAHGESPSGLTNPAGRTPTTNSTPMTSNGVPSSRGSCGPRSGSGSVHHIFDDGCTPASSHSGVGCLACPPRERSLVPPLGHHLRCCGGTCGACAPHSYSPSRSHTNSTPCSHVSSPTPRGIMGRVQLNELAAYELAVRETTAAREAHRWETVKENISPVSCRLSGGVATPSLRRSGLSHAPVNGQTRRVPDSPFE